MAITLFIPSEAGSKTPVYDKNLKKERPKQIYVFDLMSEFSKWTWFWIHKTKFWIGLKYN